MPGCEEMDRFIISAAGDSPARVLVVPTADVVVIGGGVMGCSILYNLAIRGVKNAVLLERDVLATGSTGRSVAILRMHYSNPVTAQMAWQSLKVFREFEEIVGGPSEYVQTGYLLIVDPEDRKSMEENIAMQRSLGINTSVVSLEDVKELAPVLVVKGDEGLAYEPESGYADPYAVTTSYARRAREMGAEVNLEAPVTEIEISGGKVRAVATSKGKIETPIAVIATGPWSRDVFQKVGADVPLSTVRHQVAMLLRPKDLAHPTVGDVPNFSSFRPDYGDMTLFGFGEDDEHAGPEGYSQGVDMDYMADMVERLARRMPAMSQAVFRRGWAGLFTTTPDWHPILGKVEGIEGLYCAVGFSGHGFKLSPMVGVTMAELILEGQAKTVDISPLRMGRFKEGKLLRSAYRLQVLA